MSGSATATIVRSKAASMMARDTERTAPHSVRGISVTDPACVVRAMVSSFPAGPSGLTPSRLVLQRRAPHRAAALFPRPLRPPDLSPRLEPVRNPGSMCRWRASGTARSGSSAPTAGRAAGNAAVLTGGAGTAVAFGPTGLYEGSFERTASRWVHRTALLVAQERAVGATVGGDTQRGARLGVVQPNKTPLTGH